MTKEKKKSKWKAIAGAILVLQLLISAAALGIVIWLNILPVTYVILIGLVLVWLLTFVYYFFYSGVKKKEKKKTKVYIKRSVGCTVSAIVIVLCIVASSALVKVGDTLRDVASNVIVTDTVSAYVLAENPAQTVVDAKDYVFGITEKYDYEHTQKAIEQINETAGTTIRTLAYDNVLELVKALYSGSVDAIILNAAYIDVIEAQDGYETFSKKTRTLFDHEIESVVAEGSQTTQKDITKDPFVVYISGSDTRNFKLATSRSDVNILVVVNPQTKQVLLINTPRDYYVETSVSNGQKDKLTHCGIYGIDCSMATLGNLYDEPVDYYAQINFSGFETLVDAIGGITVESEKAFRTSEGGYYISQGTNQLNGTVALSYVRERKAFADGDNSRGRHQMQVIEAIISKVSSGTTILSNYSGILDSMSGMFSTSMSSGEISSLVKMQLSDMASWNVKSFAVSGTGSSQPTYSMPSKRSYVMIPDETQIEYAKLLVNKVVDGMTLTDADMEMPQYSAQ
ncbi:MAG: LCP family protein [Lachnospiraceae bacterium]|nr:LCP family protein [Agathobacter sp.]MDD6290484.1 LCP family protein [Lachnospiraceae bacterium]